jgi:glycosyltransferase involved in cell wall biosynthesis
MKILIIASYPQSILAFRGKLIEALQISKIKEVHIVAPGLKKKSQINNHLEFIGVKTHNIKLSRNGINPISDIITLFHLLMLINKLKPQYVLAYTIKPVIYGLLAASILRVPNCFALITGLGYSFTGEAKGLRGLLKKLLIQMYKLALRNSKKIFFQNPDDKALFEFLNIIPNSNNAVIINGSGVDLKYFSEVSLPKKISFLMIARLLGDKGIHEYAYAANRIKKKHSNVLFYLVGWIDGNPDAISQTELDEWTNDGTLSFLGKLEDVRPTIAKTSVYVLPSYREGTPRTVLEAMAMGRPIITTDAPGCRETVVNGLNGYLVPVKSVDKLEEAMLKFLNNSDLCVSMGKQSRRIAEEKYDVHKVNTFMLNEMGIT